MTPQGVVVAAFVLLTTVAPAAPAPVAGDDATEQGSVLTLVWDGARRTVVEQSFVGVPVAVPGDRARRAVTVRNDGPTGGTLRAWVTRVDLLGATGGADDDFYDDLQLGWTTASQSAGASFRALADAGDTLVAQTHLAQGASTRVEVAYELPVTATSGNRARAGDRAASFVVRFQISGDSTSATPSPAPSPADGATSAAPSPSPGATPVASDLPGGGRPPAAEVSSAGRDASGALAVTGLDVLRAALVAVVGIGLGSILLGAVRRRRDVRHPIGSGSAPSAG